MGVDKETVPRAINIVIDDKPNYLKELRAQAEEDGQNESLEGDEPKKLALTDDKHSFEMEEYYFDDALDDNCINISGCMTSTNGKSFVYLTIPLSDVLLIDILQHSIKKLNKLKSVMESLS